MAQVAEVAKEVRRVARRCVAILLVSGMALGCVSVDPVTSPVASDAPNGSPSLVLATVTPAAQATHTPDPTVAPAATPSAEATATAGPTTALPVDVAAEFIRQMNSVESVEVVMTGGMRVGSADIEIDGSMSVAADGDTHTVTQAGVPGGGPQFSTEEYLIDNVSFIGNNDGPVVRQPAVDGPTPSAPGVTSIFDAIGSVTDAGEVTRNGRLLHRIVSAGGQTVDPAVLGLTDPTLRGVMASLELFADPDGSPAIFAVNAEWEYTDSGDRVPASMAVDLTFVDFGQPVQVIPPIDPWEPYNSRKFRVGAGHPAGWVVEPDSGGESLFSPGGDLFWVFSERGWRGANLMTTSADHIAGLRSYWAESDYTLTVDSASDATIDGFAARVTHLSEVASQTYVGYAVVIVDNRLYVFECQAFAGTDASGDELFEDFLTTITFDS